ncbi:hypothetical protein D3C74_210560 [compost metagenome]
MKRVPIELLYRRAHVIKRHLQHRQISGQLLQPVRFLLLYPLLLRLGLLPHGIVLVLDAQRRQLFPAIQGDELLHQNIRRDPIGDDMMHVEHQNMAVLLQLDQSDPQQRRLRKVKGPDKFAHDLIGFPFIGNLNILHRKVYLRVYPLHRLTVY